MASRRDGASGVLGLVRVAPRGRSAPPRPMAHRVHPRLVAVLARCCRGERVRLRVRLRRARATRQPGCRARVSRPPPADAAAGTGAARSLAPVAHGRPAPTVRRPLRRSRGRGPCERLRNRMVRGRLHVRIDRRDDEHHRPAALAGARMASDRHSARCLAVVARAARPRGDRHLAVLDTRLPAHVAARTRPQAREHGPLSGGAPRRARSASRCR